MPGSTSRHVQDFVDRLCGRPTWQPDCLPPVSNSDSSATRSHSGRWLRRTGVGCRDLPQAATESVHFLGSLATPSLGPHPPHLSVSRNSDTAPDGPTEYSTSD